MNNLEENALDGIKKSIWFQGLPDEAIKALAQISTVKEYHPGDALYSEGDERDYIYGLLNGSVHVSIIGAVDQSFLLIDLYENSWFGESALLLNQSKTISVIAREDSTVLVLPAKDVLVIAESYPQIYKNLYFDKMRYMQLFYDMLGGLLTYPLKARMSMRLLSILDQQGTHTQDGVVLSPKFDLGEWAKLSMGSVQRVGLVFEEWLEVGFIIDNDDSWLIPDVEVFEIEVEK